MYRGFLKRVFDFVLSLLALIILSPLFLILVVVNGIKMNGNPFFVQERPGYNEKIFKLIKFRSMTNDKDENGNYLEDDRRLTKYGEWLRNSSLDEIPELLNILKGDMSLVGPRPLLVEYLPYYTEIEKLRHTVRPGLTGLAQVCGRNNMSWNDTFKLDIKYVEELSLLLDIKIVLKTISVVFNRNGADAIETNFREALDIERGNRNV